MHSLLYSLLIISLTTFAYVHSCVYGCNCTGHTMHCECTSTPPDDELIVVPFGFIKAPPKHIEIRNCKKVTFHSWHNTGTELLSLHISNVQHLKLETNALLGNRNMHTIRIEHTTIPVLVGHSLSDIDGLHRLEFDNVTFQTIEAEAFSTLANVGNIRFASCRIDLMSSFSFHNSTIIGNFLVEKSTIKTMLANALTMSNVRNFTLQHVSVSELFGSALSAASVGHFVVRHSQLGTLHPESVSPHGVVRFDFEHNTVDRVMTEAFYNMTRVDTFNFNNNTIHHNAERSLEHKPGSVQAFKMADNSLPCNKAICWMLNDPSYTDILKNNTCNSPKSFKGKKLSYLKSFPTDDDDNLCGGGDGSILGSGHGSDMDVPLFTYSGVTMTRVTLPKLRDNQTLTTTTWRNGVSENPNESNRVVAENAVVVFFVFFSVVMMSF